MFWCGIVLFVFIAFPLFLLYWGRGGRDRLLMGSITAALAFVLLILGLFM